MGSSWPGVGGLCAKAKLIQDVMFSHESQTFPTLAASEPSSPGVFH
jgi:hypothetical protein